jgi:hypothetical protein
VASSKQLMAGRHLTSMVLTLLSVNSDGTLSNGSAATLADRSTFVGWVENVEFDTEYEIEDGTVLGAVAANDIPGVVRHTMTITEPLRYVNTGNLLASAFYNTVANGDGTTGTPYAKVTITRGQRTFTFYVLMRSYREQYGKTKCLGVLSCTMMNPEQANPSYV